MKVTFFGLVALASAVLAQGDYFQIESPSKGTTLKAGEVSTITWENGVDGKVHVNIIKGNDPQMMMPTGMSFMTSGSQNMQKWRVPTTLDPKAKYALEFNYKSPEGQVAQSFSDQFMVSPATESSNRKQTIVINNTPNNLRQTTAPSQGMKQTAQDPSKMPTRKVMRIKISYPNEDGTTADPLRVNGQSEPARMRGVTNARPAQGSVLDRYAANAASTRRSSKAGSI